MEQAGGCRGNVAGAEGVFKKLAVADYLAGFVNVVYESPREAGGFGVILGTVLLRGRYTAIFPDIQTLQGDSTYAGDSFNGKF